MSEFPNNRDLYRRTGIIEGKQDMIIEKLASLEDKVDRLIKDMERIKAEARVFGGVVSFIVAVITNAVIALGFKR